MAGKVNEIQTISNAAKIIVPDDYDVVARILEDHYDQDEGKTFYNTLWVGGETTWESSSSFIDHNDDGSPFPTSHT